MKFLRSIYLFILLASSLSLLSSCIKEDTEDCDTISEVIMYFKYTTEDMLTRSMDYNEIENVTVFIFDNEGKYLDMKLDSEPRFNDNYSMRFNLEPGEYKFVSWLNYIEHSYEITTELIKGVTTENEVTIDVIKNAEDTVTHELHNLYFGRLNDQFISGKTSQTLNMPVVRDTYSITVRTRGLSPDEDDYALKIFDNNGCLRFDNTPIIDNTICYKTVFERDNDAQLNGKLTIVRMREDLQYSVLKVKNETTGAYLFEDNLIGLILKLREQGVEVNLDRIFDYEIVLDFHEGINIGVSINGWTVVEDSGQLSRVRNDIC